ncbi:MAG TPA: BatD family protein [Planctomycetaceae bacterium]|jgi:hypothetical protein
MRRIGCVVACAACLALAVRVAPARAAGPPEIAAEVSANEIFIGESIDFLVEIRNVQDPTPPDLAGLNDDFDVKSNGDESRNQSSTMIFNGKVTQENIFSHVFRYRLTPRRTGRLKIAAPTTTIEGKTIAGRAITINVIAPEEQDLVIPEISVDRERVYPTQPFEITLRVLVHPLPDDPDRDPLAPLHSQPPHLDVNWVDLPAGLAGDDKARWLGKLLSRDGAGFTLNDVSTRGGGFFEGPRAAVLNLYQRREQRDGLDGRSINYFVYELRRRMTPEKSGTFVFGPVTVKGTFAVDKDKRQYKGQRLVAIAPAVDFEVREVPSPRPATFCGGIGQYQVSASASPSELRVGDPLTLTLNVERGAGSGSLESISAPDLTANSRISDDFEIVDKNPTGRAEGDTKGFAYALRPKRAGVGIPAIGVTVFNPDTEEFEEISTRPVALKVSEASRLGAGELVGSFTGSGPQEIKSREQGIFQNVTDPTELRDQNVNVTALAELAAGLWGVVGCLAVVVTSRRRKSGDVVWQRRQQARRTAARKLAEARAAQAAGRSPEALRSVRSAVVGLVADLRNMVAEGLTAAETEALLASSSVPADLQGEVRRLLDSIESAEYGSGSGAASAALIEQAEGLIVPLARQLDRGS